MEFNIENAKTVVYPGIIFKYEYKIDDKGNVWSPYRGGQLMSQQEIAKGYLRVPLTTTEGRKFFMVHRLVLEAFAPKEGSLQFQVNHIDGDKHNNQLSNLEWCTGLENIAHAYRNNLARKAHGEDVGGVKLTEEKVLEICELLKSKKYSLSEIGMQYGVSKHCIFDIKRKRSWSWLTKDYKF